MRSCSIPWVLSLALPLGATSLLVAGDGGGDCLDFPCGNKDQKVLICHAPPGNPANAKTLCIEPDSASDHLASHPHDICGPCEGGAVAAGREGDLSGDGHVGIRDLVLLLAEWGQRAESAADLDHDAVVGGDDLLALVMHWD